MFCLQAQLLLPSFIQFSSILAHLSNAPVLAAPIPRINPPYIMRLYGNERVRAAAQLSEKQFANEMHGLSAGAEREASHSHRGLQLVGGGGGAVVDKPKKKKCFRRV